MDAQLLAECKQKLLDLQMELEKDLATVADPDTGDHVVGDFAAKYPDFGHENYLDPGSDTVDELQEFQVNMSITEQIEDHLKKVRAALQRMEDGTYGTDINTGEEISIERLRVNPAAETAIPGKNDSAQ